MIGIYTLLHCDADGGSEQGRQAITYDFTRSWSLPKTKVTSCLNTDAVRLLQHWESFVDIPSSICNFSQSNHLNQSYHPDSALIVPVESNLQKAHWCVCLLFSCWCKTLLAACMMPCKCMATWFDQESIVFGADLPPRISSGIENSNKFSLCPDHLIR